MTPAQAQALNADAARDHQRLPNPSELARHATERQQKEKRDRRKPNAERVNE